MNNQKEKIEEWWEKEFELNWANNKGYNFRGYWIDKNSGETIKSFIRRLLLEERQKVDRGWRIKINNWISTNEKNEEYLSSEDLKYLLKN